MNFTFIITNEASPTNRKIIEALFSVMRSCTEHKRKVNQKKNDYSKTTYMIYQKQRDKPKGTQNEEIIFCSKRLIPD